MTFTKKAIDVSFTLANALDASGNPTGAQRTFKSQAGSNKVTLSGLRITAHIQKAGGDSQGQAQVRIYGMPLPLMNELSTLGRTPIYIDRNQLAISAGDAGTQLGLIFVGEITQAYTDLGGPPQGVFVVSAMSMAFQSSQSIPPTSFKGAVDVALIMQNLAVQMGLSFQNYGVSVMLSNPYFSGSALAQAKDAVAAAQIEWNAGDNGVLEIWPRNGSRTQEVPLISAKTGMVGSPYPSGQGLLGVKTAFNPNINFGAQVKVESIIQPANGLWKVCTLEHDIESEMPGGAWFTTLLGTPPNYLAVR